MNYSTEKTEAGLLKWALLGNAAFSATCGLLIVVFDNSIASVMGSIAEPLWPLGAMLLGFGAYLAWFASRPKINSAWVISVVVADFAWVIGTAVLLFGWRELFSATGTWVLIGIAAVVFAFAELQWVGLRRLRFAQS